LEAAPKSGGKKDTPWEKKANSKMDGMQRAVAQARQGGTGDQKTGRVPLDPIPARRGEDAQSGEKC